MRRMISLFATALMAAVSFSQAAQASETEDDGAGMERTENVYENTDPNLNYALGIQEGIYGWTLSEDGSYYMLSAINEDGTPKESTASRNAMSGGMQHRGMPHDGMKMSGSGKGDGASMRNGNGDAESDPLAMEENEMSSRMEVNAQGVYTESSITNPEYQNMLVFVPAEYLTVNQDGTASFTDATVGGYTAKTAPVIYQNNNGGWRSGSPKAPEYAQALEAGMIYVSAGSRSRDAMDEDGNPTGKAPTPVVDLKAGIIALRANTDTIPGDMERIISVGASGGGQMSSAVGAAGNMEEYYPYLYEAGAIGVTYDEETGSYSSAYDDSVYAVMAYCPIADIENADLAYAWLRYDSTTNEDGTLTQTAGGYALTPFQLALQEDEAYAFAEYINSLSLTDGEGNLLTFDENEDGTLNLRAGSYYEKTLQNIADALNATLATLDEPDSYLAENYGDTSSWLEKDENGTYVVTDLAGFIQGTNLVRNKDVPGFDAADLSAENDAFGTAEDSAVHFSASTAKLIRDNYDAYSGLEGFDADQADLYIENALTGESADTIAQQTFLVNSVAIMLDVAAGKQDADIAKYWRTRNGTADQHTSFSVAYNLTLAAEMAGADADYALVWAMGHGSNEGTTTGTFVDWINEITAGE